MESIEAFLVEDNAMKVRLEKVKTAVRKATEEALHKTGGSNNEGPVAKLRSFADNNTENEDPNVLLSSSSESFALGMALFGQESAVVEREIRDHLTRIEKELTEVVKAIETTSSASANDNNDKQISVETLHSESKELKTRIKFLSACSTARSHLDEAANVSSVAASNDPDYVEAAKQLQLAMAMLGEAEAMVKAEESRSSEPTKALFGAYRIIDSIRSAIRRRKVDLLSRAKSLLESSIAVSFEAIVVKGARITSSSNQQRLQGLHAAYDILAKLSPSDASALEGTIRKIADKFVDAVIQPVLNEVKQCGKSCGPWKFEEPSSRITHSLEWSLDEDLADDGEMNVLESLNNAFYFIQRTVTFFHKHVLLERQDLCELVGERFFGSSKSTPLNGLSIDLRSFGVESKYVGSKHGSVMKIMVESIWDHCIPDAVSSDDLPKLKGMAKQFQEITQPFDASMRSLKLYMFDEEEESPLEEIATKFEQKFVEKRRCTVLNDARDIILKNDYHNTEQIGDVVQKPGDMLDDDGLSVFRFHECAVSQTAVRIMKLCRKTMDETVSIKIDDPESPVALLPPTLYRTSREILDLFRAIIPATYDKEIQEIPRTAAVLHNDALFFSHCCLTLGLEYKEKFPPANQNDIRGQALRQTCMFVDMVPVFRELADKALGDMIEKQHGQLWELAGSRIDLLGPALQSNDSLSEWVDAETAMNAALYHIRHLSQSWAPVLSREVYARSIGFLLDTVFNMYLEQIFKADDISEPACHFVSSIFRSAMSGAMDLMHADPDGCQVWDRFSAIGRFMDMSLADINVALSDGVFKSITGPELSRLISATFGDSEKRRFLLQALASES